MATICNEETVGKEFLTEDEAAERLGVPVRTLQTWRHQRRVLPFVKFGRNVRYAISTIEEHVRKNTVAVDA